MLASRAALSLVSATDMNCSIGMPRCAMYSMAKVAISDELTSSATGEPKLSKMELACCSNVALTASSAFRSDDHTSNSELANSAVLPAFIRAVSPQWTSDNLEVYPEGVWIDELSCPSRNVNIRSRS